MAAANTAVFAWFSIFSLDQSWILLEVNRRKQASIQQVPCLLVRKPQYFSLAAIFWFYSIYVS